MFHNPDKYEWTRETQRANTKMTVGSFFTYVAPAIWGILVGLGSGGSGESGPFWAFKVGCLFLMPFGIWKTKPGWRRWLGSLMLLGFLFLRRDLDPSARDIEITVWLLGWYLAFQGVYYADGQEYKRKRQRADWER